MTRDSEIGQLDPVATFAELVLLRRFEELVERLSNAGEIPGSCHLYIGQEAVAVGVIGSLREKDVFASTHRGHGHLLARGVPPSLMLAELLARETGLNAGRAGSMHMADLDRGILGANGIVAGGVPWVVGASWTFRRRAQDRVGVAFFGDGGLNQGVLHESLNLASIWDAPVLFVCENNGYAVSTPTVEATAGDHLDRVRSYGLPVRSVDGMRVDAVDKAAKELIDRVREGDGPAFLECRTYRYRGHHIGEAALGLSYRSQEEVDEALARDPLEEWRVRSGMSVDEATSVEARVAEGLEADLQWAREQPAVDDSTWADFAYAQPW